MRKKVQENFVVDDISLTPRELETLSLIAKGLTNIEIARKMKISVSTVLNTLYNLSVKIVYQNDTTPKSTKRVLLARWYHQYVIGIKSTMKITELIEELNKLAQNNNDPEDNHAKADDLLLKFINDVDVTEAFEKIEKWYS